MEDMINRFFQGLGPLKLQFLNTFFEKLEDVEDMFAFVWDIEEAHHCLVPPVICHKSETDAERARIEGNFLYKSGNLKASLECYDGCIIIAPHPDVRVSAQPEENEGNTEKLIPGARCEPQCCEDDLKKFKTLALGYANRSAVFLALKDYDNCLSDIDMALKYGYPTQLRSKLEGRKERCLTAKERAGNVSPIPDIVSNNGKIPPRLAEPNTSVPAFSSALKVAYSPGKGRHVIAARDILPGELIAVEKSYCSHVYASPDEDTYCPVCLMQCQNKIPCPSCALICFCSDFCRAKGLKEHMKECKNFTALNYVDLEEDILTCLAMKLIVHTTYAELKDKWHLLKKENQEFPDEKLGFDGNGKFRSTDYRSVYHMVSSRTKKRQSNVLQVCLKAFYITKVLEQSQDFFVTREGLPFRPHQEDYRLTGTALLHHMIFSTTAFCISDIKVGPRDVNTTKKVVGNAIYPALSLMRHSCNPPNVYYNFGHVKIVRMVSPISAGQEVTLSMVDRFQTTPLLFRVIQFEIAGIECSCEACVGLWPSIPGIPDEMHFKCIKCSNPVTGTKANPSCEHCSIHYSKKDSKGKKKNTLIKKWWSVVDHIKEGEQKFERIWRKFEMGQMVTKNDYEIICKFAGLIGKHVQQPSMIFTKLRDVFLMFFYREM